MTGQHRYRAGQVRGLWAQTCLILAAVGAMSAVVLIALATR